MYTKNTLVTDDVQQLIDLFHQTFFAKYNTRLVAGGQEPMYLPASSDCDYHQIIFAHGFFASALHEIAHWCIAGEYRRQYEDYGYWYLPDGRTASQQRQFEQVEIQPQALEWLFTQACGRKFHASADNLNAHHRQDTKGAEATILNQDIEQNFRLAVSAQARYYLQHDLPARANAWLQVLQQTQQRQVQVDDFYWPEDNLMT